MKFRSTKTIEAFKYGTHAVPDWFKVFFDQLPEHMKRNGFENCMKNYKSKWIVNNDGTFFALDNKEFQKRYQPVESEEA